MHADGPRAVGPHGKPVEASASTTASDVGAMLESASQYLNPRTYIACRTRSTARTRGRGPAAAGHALRSRREAQHAMSFMSTLS